MKPIPFGSEPTLGYGIGGPLAWALFELPNFVFNLLLSLVHWLGASCVALARGTRTPVRYVEAVTFSFYPHESRTWTTTSDQLDQVIEQIVAGIKQGDNRNPAGATFLGVTTPSL